MLPCIDPEVGKYLAEHVDKDDAVERTRLVFMHLDARCLRDLAKEIGVSHTALYHFRIGRTKEPSLDLLHKIWKYLAPGYRIALVPGNEPGPGCVLPLPEESFERRFEFRSVLAPRQAVAASSAAPAEEWRPVAGHPYEALYVDGVFTKKVRPAAA